MSGDGADRATGVALTLIPLSDAELAGRKVSPFALPSLRSYLKSDPKQPIDDHCTR